MDSKNIGEYLRIGRAIRIIADELELTNSSLECFLYLGSQGYSENEEKLISVSKLTEELGSPAQSTVSEALKTLRRKGWARTHLLQTDIRTHLVGITEEGERVYKNIESKL